jgi:hypothetical protein
MAKPIRSLPITDQIAIREIAREIIAQADGIMTMLEAVKRARAELKL